MLCEKQRFNKKPSGYKNSIPAEKQQGYAVDILRKLLPAN
jgi:hypothetical protein